MRFVQFQKGDSRCIGLELKQNGDFINLNAADPAFPSDMRSFIENGNGMLQAAQRILNGDHAAFVEKRDSVKLLAPVTSCDKVLCVGMNYIDHCEEQNVPVPVEPVIFNKFPGCITGPNDTLTYPTETECLDWEVEMVIVVGKQGKNIKVEDAMSHVFGYTIANDVSARDLQLAPGKNGGQWLLGKAMDEFCPLGPAIVSLDEIGDPHNLGLRCRVNGVIKQDSNTNQLVHKTEQVLAFISRFMTLRPGDLILTGTPPGVGCFRKPPEYLKKGDTVEVEVDKIGTCLDWEVEMVIAVGKQGKNIKVEDAMSHVFGYTIANDVSARDLQLAPGKNGGQWLLGKAMDEFCPLGPAIVSLDEIGDPHNLGLRCRVNGVIKQDSNTNQLVHKTEQVLAFISRFMTLRPGDLILTGTSPSVGCFRKPPEYLKEGDIVEVEVDKIGTVITKVV